MAGVGAVGAIGSVSSGTSVYAILSPYLNGVVRTSDAAQLAQIDAASQATNPAVAQSSIAANGNAAAAATAFPPFDNPALTSIGTRIALGQAISTQTGATPDALLSSQTISGGQTSPLAVSNLVTLASFNAIDSTNSIATLNTLNAANTANSLTNTTALNTPALASISQASLTQLNTLNSIDTFNSVNAVASLNALDTTNATTAANAADLTNPATNPLSATNTVLTGDAGTLIQSYGAALFAASSVALPASALAAFTAPPVIPPAAQVTAAQPVSAVA